MESDQSENMEVKEEQNTNAHETAMGPARGLVILWAHDGCIETGPRPAVELGFEADETL